MNPIKPIHILLLMIASSATFAEWTQVTTSYQSTSYADIKSIQKTGDIVAMNILIDYEKVPFDGNNLPYLSVKMQAEYNCTTQQFRTVNLTSYSGHMATGHQPYTSTETSEWQPILPRHNQEPFWKMACEF